MAASLAHATVVFLGIGDVAAYVRVRLNQLLQELGNTDHVIVVSPRIAGNWTNTGWSQILPDLPEEQKWEFGASEFAEELLRGWVIDALAYIRRLARETSTELVSAFGALNAVLTRTAIVLLLTWIRRSHHRPRVGQDLSHHPMTAEALLALAVVSRTDPITSVPRMGRYALSRGTTSTY